MDQDSIHSNKKNISSNSGSPSVDILDDVPSAHVTDNSGKVVTKDGIDDENDQDQDEDEDQDQSQDQDQSRDQDQDQDQDSEKDESLDKDNHARPNKRKAIKKDDRQHGSKRTRWDNRRIPNIAAELAKNRNIVRGPSPNSATASSSPTIPQLSKAPSTAKSDSEAQTPEPSDSSEKKDTHGKRTQVKISSLLSSNGEESPSSSLTKLIKSESEMSISNQANVSIHAPVPSSSSPKVILPTQLPGGSLPETNDSSTKTPGVLIARMSSPVSVPPQTHLKKSLSNITGENKQQAELAQKTASTPSISHSREKHNNGTSGNTSNDSKKKPSSKSIAGKHSNNVGSDSSSNSKSVSALGGSNALTKDNSMVKKEPSGNLKRDGASSLNKKEGTNLNSVTKDNKKDVALSGAKKENSSFGKSNEKKEGKSTGKTTAKKESNSGNGNIVNNSKVTESKKKPPMKKESGSVPKTTKTPKKLVAAPPIKSPSLLEVLERGKTQEESEEPALIVDVPLYSTENNDYLDENGQVVFNFYKVVQDKFSAENDGGNIGDFKAAKRNLFGQISGNQIDGAAEEDDDGIEEVEEEGEEEEEEEGEEPKQNASPKKKSHPNKGKSLIGKYDTEDPFIDDTELLWEEQRAATKDGFFVYFGPLIEKGHYASLERADGTMKRGGVKNK